MCESRWKVPRKTTMREHQSCDVCAIFVLRLSSLTFFFKRLKVKPFFLIRSLRLHIFSSIIAAMPTRCGAAPRHHISHCWKFHFYTFAIMHLNNNNDLIIESRTWVVGSRDWITKLQINHIHRIDKMVVLNFYCSSSDKCIFNKEV